MVIRKVKSMKLWKFSYLNWDSTSYLIILQQPTFMKIKIKESLVICLMVCSPYLLNYPFSFFNGWSKWRFKRYHDFYLIGNKENCTWPLTVYLWHANIFIRTNLCTPSHPKRTKLSLTIITKNFCLPYILIEKKCMQQSYKKFNLW